MLELKDALYTKYLGDANLVAALPNGLHYQTAPPRTEFPYATYFIVSNIPGRTFTEKMENLLIQFNIFSDTSDDAEVENIFNKLIVCYDDCRLTLSVDGYSTIYVDRTFSQLLFDDGDNIWQHVITYRVELQSSSSSSSFSSSSFCSSSSSFSSSSSSFCSSSSSFSSSSFSSSSSSSA